MTLLIVSFVAGFLTILAPCILPLLPLVLGGSVLDPENRARPQRIIFALAGSVFVFTLLLKVSTIFIDVPEPFWRYFSGGLLLVFGLTLLFPEAYAKTVAHVPGYQYGNRLLAKGASEAGSLRGDTLVGVALGPVFTTCSPTFFVILATVLPASTLKGLLYLLAYIAGLSLSLYILARAGQRFADKLGLASDPRGIFKRVIGILFIVLAILIATGIEKRIETKILDSGFFDVTKYEARFQRYVEGIFSRVKETVGNMADESGLSDATDTKSVTTAPAEIKDPERVQSVSMAPDKTYNAGDPRYVDFVSPSGFVNASPFRLQDIVGKKVILLDFMTYSCINCQRTFPYLNAWYEKYRSMGLEIVGVHTPEFAFEQKLSNVQDAAMRFRLAFPLVLDNNYDTWRAYKNNYWPHKYLIAYDGKIVFDHVGEGGYAEMEEKIVEELGRLNRALGKDFTAPTKTSVPAYSTAAQSPETYFGASRNNNFGNGTPFTAYEGIFTLPATMLPNVYYLEGKWRIEDEYITSRELGAALQFVFNAKDVYIVAESDIPVDIEVFIDGVSVGTMSGMDVASGLMRVSTPRLYHVFHGLVGGSHHLKLAPKTPGVKLYTFTFG